MANCFLIEETVGKTLKAPWYVDSRLARGITTNEAPGLPVDATRSKPRTWWRRWASSGSRATRRRARSRHARWSAPGASPSAADGRFRRRSFSTGSGWLPRDETVTAGPRLIRRTRPASRALGGRRPHQGTWRGPRWSGLPRRTPRGAAAPGRAPGVRPRHGGDAGGVDRSRHRAVPRAGSLVHGAPHGGRAALARGDASRAVGRRQVQDGVRALRLPRPPRRRPGAAPGWREWRWHGCIPAALPRRDSPTGIWSICSPRAAGWRSAWRSTWPRVRTPCWCRRGEWLKRGRCLNVPTTPCFTAGTGAAFNQSFVRLERS